MAIKRIPRKHKSFEYEGEKFSMRRPRVEEMIEITRLTSEYSRTIKADLKQDVADGIVDYSVQTGNIGLMMAVQKYIAMTLVVDEDNKSIFGPEGEDVTTVDADFLAAAWNCYAGNDEKPQAENAIVIEPGDTTPDPLAATDATTTSNSGEASSSSPSSSTLTLAR